jgi:hypothetical protein
MGARGTNTSARSPVFTDRERAWMAMSYGVKWYTRQAATGSKCWAEGPVHTDKELALMANIFRAI